MNYVFMLFIINKL